MTAAVLTAGVVEFLSNSRVSCAHEDFREIKYDEYLKKLDLNETESVYTHDFRLASAYNSKIMPYTNYTSVHAYNAYISSLHFLHQLCYITTKSIVGS